MEHPVPEPTRSTPTDPPDLSRRQALRLLGVGTAGALGLVFASCSTSAPVTTSTPTASAPAIAPSPSAGASPQAAPSQVAASTATAWDGMVAAAQKESQVVVSGPPDPDADTKIPDAFKQAYGIDVQYLSGNSSQLAARIQSERAAGQYTIDVSLSGSDTVYGTYLANNWLDPLKPSLVMPEAIDPSVWPTGGPWFRDPQADTVLQISNTVSLAAAINTSLVSPQDVATLDTLLDPKWIGKIGAYNPGVSGEGLALACAIYVTKGADYATQLYKGQQVALSRDYQQVADWVAHGTYAIVLATAHQFLVPYLGTLPIQEVSFSDVPLTTSGAFGLVNLYNNAPHPNAARVFANWLASRDGATVFCQVDGSAPVRTDVTPTWVPADQVPKPGGSYLDTYDYTFETTQRIEIRDFFAKVLS